MRLAIILLFATFVSFLHTSCNRNDEPITPTITPTTGADEEDDDNDDEENDSIKDMTTAVPVAFIAKIDERYELEEYGMARCALEIYSGANKVYETTNIYTQPSHVYTMTAEIDEGNHYTCLLWVDFDEDGYDVSNGLKDVKTGSNPSLAFYGTLDFNTDTKKYEVMLQPAVAKAVLAASDGTPNGIGSFGVSHAMSFRHSFNVADGNAFIDDEAVPYTPEIIFAINSMPEESEVAHFYTFVPNDGLTVDLDIDFNGTYHEEKDVALRKGCATTLTGNLGTMDFNIKITDLRQEEPNIDL